MIFTPLLLIINATFSSYNNFYAKDTLQKGIKTNAYIYALNVALLVFSVFLFIFYPFDITFKLDLILLIILAAILRIGDLFGMVKGLEVVTPMEMVTFGSLATAITYFIDVSIGASSFKIFALLAILLVVLGTFILSKGNTGFNKAKLALILKVTMSVARGYVAYFILKQISPASYIFFMAFLGCVFLLPFTKQIKPTTVAFKKAFLIQIFGVVSFLFAAILSASSATLYMLVTPLSLAITILATYFINKQKTSRVQFIASIIVLLGVLSFAFTQL
ncbi:MAG: hypothetical protein AB7S44_01680 [Spirochaetales bacterium]